MPGSESAQQPDRHRWLLTAADWSITTGAVGAAIGALVFVFSGIAWLLGLIGGWAEQPVGFVVGAAASGLAWLAMFAVAALLFRRLHVMLGTRAERGSA